MKGIKLNDYNEYANIHTKRSVIMKRFVEIAHTMSPINFKKFFKYLTQIDLWTVVENNIYSILTRIHAELMQLK